MFKKLFINQNTKGRDVIAVIATAGFSKSAWCDAFCSYLETYYKNHTEENDVVVATAISFNTVFGDYTIVSRLLSSYFLDKIKASTVRQFCDVWLPAWDVHLRQEKAKYDNNNAALQLPQIDLECAVRVILADYKEKHPHTNPRCCILVDEISKADDKRREDICSILYRTMDNTNYKPQSMQELYSLVMTGLDFSPFLHQRFDGSGGKVFPVYMGALDARSSLLVLQEAIVRSQVHFTDDSHVIATYLNHYLHGHPRSYEWCEGVLTKFAQTKASVSLLEVLDALDKNIKMEN